MCTLQSLFTVILLTLTVITNARAQDFHTVIEEKADAAGIELKQLSESMYAIEIEMPGGNTQTVYIRKANSDSFRESIIEIQVPSFNPDDLDISAETKMQLMIHLMAMNQELEVGSWTYCPSIERTTMMTNYRGDSIRDMKPQHFREILVKMATVVYRVADVISNTQSNVLGIAGSDPMEGLRKKLSKACRTNKLNKAEFNEPELIK